MDGIASFLKPYSPSKPDIAVDYSPDSFLENAQAQFWNMASNETTTYRDLRQIRMESDRLDALRPYIGDNPDYTKMAGFETLTEEDKALVRGEFSLSRLFLGDSKEAALKAAAADFERAIQWKASARSVQEPAAPRGASKTTLDAINHSNGINPNLAYTVKQVADFLQLSQDTVMGFCRTKVWKCSFQRNAYRIKGSVVLEWLEGK